MKVHSLLGPKEIPAQGTTYLTDDNDDVEVPDELGASLLEQEDAWAPAGGSRKKTKPDVADAAPETEEG